MIPSFGPVRAIERLGACRTEFYNAADTSPHVTFIFKYRPAGEFLLSYLTPIERMLILNFIAILEAAGILPAAVPIGVNPQQSSPDWEIDELEGDDDTFPVHPLGPDMTAQLVRFWPG